MECQFNFPHRELNTLALIESFFNEKKAREAMDIRFPLEFSIISDNTLRNSGREIYATVPCFRTFGKPAWYLGSIKRTDYKTVEAWYPESDYSKHILICHQNEKIRWLLSYVIMLNALLSGKKIIGLFSNSAAFNPLSEIALTFGMRTPQFDINLRTDITDHLEENALIVFPLNATSEKRLSDSELQAISKARSRKEIFLFVADNMSEQKWGACYNVFRHFILSNTKIKLMDTREYLPYDNTTGELTIMNPGFVTCKSIRTTSSMPEENIRKFQEACEKKDADAMLRYAMAVLNSFDDEGANAAFLEMAKRFLQAWIPLIVHKEGYAGLQFLKANLSAENCSALAKDGAVEAAAGWETMAAYWSVLGSMGWNGKTSNTIWMEKMGYALGYINIFFSNSANAEENSKSETSEA